MTPILFTNSHAIYSIGFISNGAWDEDSQSYAVDVEKELVTSLAQLFARGYTVSVKATIESSDGTSEAVFTAKKVERQETPDGNVVYITFDNGATLTDTLFTISYAESGGGGGGVGGVFLITDNVTFSNNRENHVLNKTYREIAQAYNAGKLCIITSLIERSDFMIRTSEYVGSIKENHDMSTEDMSILFSLETTRYFQFTTDSADGYPHYLIVS